METEQEVRKLQERIDQLEQSVERQSELLAKVRRDPYVVAQQVFGALRFYRDLYGSTGEYQNRFQDVLELLRTSARTVSGRDASRGKFLLGLADLLEEENKPGIWPGLKESS